VSKLLPESNSALTGLSLFPGVVLQEFTPATVLAAKRKMKIRFINGYIWF